MYFANFCFAFLLLTKRTTSMDVLEYKQFFVADNLSTEAILEESCTRPTACDNTIKFYTFEGMCNNLCYPARGGAKFPLRRILNTTYYSDEIHAPPKSESGSELPNARVVSANAFSSSILDLLDSNFTVLVMVYGQIIAHDTIQTINKTDCCPDTTPNEVCLPIEVYPNDTRFQFCPDLDSDERYCMNYVRSITSDCSISKAKQILNFATSFVDLSFLYGSNNVLAKSLRLFEGGLLRYQTIDGYMYLPEGINCLDCGPEKKAKYCFLAGDIRVNQHPTLTALHTLYLREHNRIAKILAEVNPEWTDDMIFEDTRRTLIGIHHIITYRDWLPIILGDTAMRKYDLYPKVELPGDCYDCDIDATTILEFNTGCFRYFHTLIRKDILFYSSPTEMVGSVPLSDTLYFPDPMVQGLDQVLYGMVGAAMQKADTVYTTEITEKMLKGCKTCGLDLVAMDVQRHNDYGLKSYNDMRVLCGFKRATCFQDFGDLISYKNVKKLQSLYESPDDVQLYVGASLENHQSGSLIGPTCTCVIALQFQNWKCGDRFFFPKYSMPDQAREMYKYTFAHIICHSGNNITEVTTNPFRLPSESNPVVKCCDLPEPDWEKWFGVTVFPWFLYNDDNTPAGDTIDEIL